MQYGKDFAAIEKQIGIDKASVSMLGYRLKLRMDVGKWHYDEKLYKILCVKAKRGRK